MRLSVAALAVIAFAVAITVNAEPEPSPRANLPACRKGYSRFGTMCYKLVWERMSWQGAAVNCGADNAELARYDTELDKSLGKFFEGVRNLRLRFRSSRRVIKCKAGSECALPKNRAGVRVTVRYSRDAVSCNNKMSFSKCGKKLIVKAGCKATQFYVNIVGLREYYSKLPTLTWVGGNKQVLNFNQRNGQSPFQVDPPRLLNAEQFKGKGCFHAGRVNGKLTFKLRHCGNRLPSVCGYDIGLSKDYNSLDFVVIKKKVIHSEAVIECNKMNRHLATITHTTQQERIFKMMKGLQSDVWISAKYNTKSRAFVWGDGTPISFAKWYEKAPRSEKNSVAHHCSSLYRCSGTWETRKCEEKYFPLCGPPDKKNAVFTPMFQTKGCKDIYELKEKLIRLQKKDYVCPEPLAVECLAKAVKGGQWVSSNFQSSDTLRCSKRSFFCKSGKELDCSTLVVRFLCPREKDQCKALQELKAPACLGDQQCFPLTHHYVCRCQPNHVYSHMSKKCVQICGECSSWGDPHYTNLRGKRFNFQGSCKYKFTGVCNKNDFKDKPYFDMYSTNERCPNKFRPDSTCLSAFELRLRNIPVKYSCGYTFKKDFTFKVKVRSDYYELNGKKVRDQVVDKKKVYKAIVRQNYFSLTVFPLNMLIFLNGGSLRVQIPKEFRGKLCGLCGDCATDAYKMRNGTVVEVKMNKEGTAYDDGSMIPVASSWLVDSKEFENQTCGVQRIKNTCTREMMNKVRAKDLCGIFLDKTNQFNQCFEKGKLNRNTIHYGCVYDLCEMKDAKEGLCTVIESFAQQCSAKGIPIEWRRENFCPPKCGKGKVYRLNAACQRKCGEEKRSESDCNEEPAEGCVCEDGLYRLGDKCVPYAQCGCRVLDEEGNFVKLLQPNETVVMPRCREEVICEREDDGSLSSHAKDFTMPPNSACTGDIPPSVICARGYMLDKSGKNCIRKSKGCKAGFVSLHGMCVNNGPGDVKLWKDATQYCKSKKGSLLYIDTEEKVKSVYKIMESKGWEYMHVVGRVRGVNTFGHITIESAESTAERGTLDWVNEHFYSAFLDRIEPSYCVQATDIPEEGLEMTVMAHRKGPVVYFKAVKTFHAAHFVCEQSE